MHGFRRRFAPTLRRGTMGRSMRRTRNLDPAGLARSQRFYVGAQMGRALGRDWPRHLGLYAQQSREGADGDHFGGLVACMVHLATVCARPPSMPFCQAAEPRSHHHCKARPLFRRWSGDRFGFVVLPPDGAMHGMALQREAIARSEPLSSSTPLCMRRSTRCGKRRIVMLSARLREARWRHGQVMKLVVDHRVPHTKLGRVVPWLRKPAWRELLPRSGKLDLPSNSSCLVVALSRLAADRTSALQFPWPKRRKCQCPRLPVAILAQAVRARRPVGLRMRPCGHGLGARPWSSFAAVALTARNGIAEQQCRGA